MTSTVLVLLAPVPDAELLNHRSYDTSETSDDEAELYFHFQVVGMLPIEDNFLPRPLLSATLESTRIVGAYCQL